MARKNIISLVIVVFCGVLVQALFAAMDCEETPADTAIKFARAYYRLDPSLAQWVVGDTATCDGCACENVATCPKANCNKKPDCSENASAHATGNSPEATSVNEPKTCAKANCQKKMARRINNAVDNHLYEARVNATERGFKEKFVSYGLYHIETRTEYLDDTTAVVHLTAHRRVSVNPLYAYVAMLFRLGDTHEVDESIHLRKRDDNWQVYETSLLS